jgi:uroporphyrin-III C-methyltransferase
MPGWVYLVGAGPGAADLITLRGWQLLQSADVAVVDALADAELLQGLSVEVLHAGKRAGQHGMSQTEINQLLVQLAQDGRAVVRLKGGDPFVLGRGSEELQALAHAGVPCEVVPGVSSAIGGPALAGIPVTHRGLADAVCIVSAHLQAGDAVTLPAFQPRLTLVVLMGVSTLQAWLPRLADLGWPLDTPLAVVTWAGRPNQQVLQTHLQALLADSAPALRSPSVFVLGQVASLGPALRLAMDVAP